MRQEERHQVMKRRFTSHVHVNSINVTRTVRSRLAALTLSGVPQWTMVAFDNFENAKSLKTRGWSSDAVSSCGSSKDKFLGGYCKFSDKKVTKTYNKLPIHTALRLTARLHFLDKWEGQYMYVMVNDKIVWMQNHRHCSSIFASSCKGINVCGDDNYSDRLSLLVDVTVRHDNTHLHPNPLPLEARLLAFQKQLEGERVAFVNHKNKKKVPGKKMRFSEQEFEESEDEAGVQGDLMEVEAHAHTHADAEEEEQEEDQEEDGPVSPTAFKPKSKPKKGAKIDYKDTDTVTITFGAGAMLGVDPCVASWGIDDVTLFSINQSNTTSKIPPKPHI